MAKAQTPRTAWIEAALRALAVGGPEAIRVEALAASLGVTKGGFYWHFEDRKALIEEMLDSWEKTWTEDVIVLIEGSEGDPRQKLRELLELGRSADFEVELAIRDWSRRDVDVARRLRRIDKRRMKFLRSLFGPLGEDEEDVEARCLLAYSLLIGSYFIAPEASAGSRPATLQLALDRLLDAWPEAISAT